VVVTREAFVADFNDSWFSSRTHTDACYARHLPSPWQTIAGLSTCRDLLFFQKLEFQQNCGFNLIDSNVGGQQTSKFGEQRNALCAWSLE
jgi:hypothetical protein